MSLSETPPAIEPGGSTATSTVSPGRTASAAALCGFGRRHSDRNRRTVRERTQDSSRRANRFLCGCTGQHHSKTTQGVA